MKNIKKLIALVLATLMVLSLVACGGTEDPVDTTGSSNDTQPQNNTGTKRTITIGVWWDFYYDSTHDALEDDPSYVGSEADVARFEIIDLIEQT